MDNMKALKLYVTCDAMYDTMALLIITKGLQLINQNHQENLCEGGEDWAEVTEWPVRVGWGQEAPGGCSHGPEQDS